VHVFLSRCGQIAFGDMGDPCDAADCCNGETKGNKGVPECGTGVAGGPCGEENGGKGVLKDCKGVVDASRGVELWCGEGVNDEVMSTSRWPL
jgi:hypothetical protein